MSEQTRLTRALQLFAILLGTLLGPLDSSVNIAFPDITQHFGIDVKSIRWVVIVYVSTYASLMLGFGRIGDLFGHRRVFLGGLIVCTVGFTLCSLAHRFELLLVARVIQGMGTAMVLSCGAALATHLYDERHRPRLLGAYAMCFGLGGAVGPVVGGALVELFGWTAAFWTRIPLALLALTLLLVLKLPAPPPSRGVFSTLSSVSLAVAIGLFLFAVSQLEMVTHQLQRYLLVLGTTAIAITGLVLLLRRASTPLMEWRLFANFNFSWINAVNLVVNFAGFATLLFVPYFLVTISALPLSVGGLFMGFGAIGMITGAHLGGRLLRWQSGERLALVGASLVSVGLLAMSQWHDQTGHLGLIVPLVLHGAGMGLCQVAVLEVVTGTLKKRNRGVAGSLVLVVRTVGVVLAASVLTLVFSTTLSATQGESETFAFANAFKHTLRVAGLGLFSFTVVSLLRTSLLRQSY